MTPEEEKEFYLESLRDLEKEYEAGDVDEKDYNRLKAAYTKKASQALKSESSLSGVSTKSQKPTSSVGSRRAFYKRWVVITLGVVLLLSVVGGIVLALSSGQRSSNEEATGDVRPSTRSSLTEVDRLLAEAIAQQDIDGIATTVPLYEEVLDTDPANVGAMNSLAQAHFLLEEYDTARNYLNDALALEPNNNDALILFATVELEADSYDAAQVYLDRLYALEPDPEFLEEREVSVLQDLIYLNRIVDTYGGIEPENDPAEIEEFGDLGLPDIETGLRFAQVLSDPRLAEPQYYLSSIILDLLVAENPENIDILIVHASVLTDPDYGLDEEVSDRGFESFDKLIELEPDNTEFLFRRADAYYRVEKYDEAIADITAAIELEPENTNHVLVRAATYDSLQRYDEAIADLDGLIEENQESLSLQLIKGEILFNAERYDESLEVFATARELDPDNPRVAYNRGLVFYTTEDYSQSLIEIDTALDILATDIEGYRALGAGGADVTDALDFSMQLQERAENLRVELVRLMDEASNTIVPDAN